MSVNMLLYFVSLSFTNSCDRNRIQKMKKVEDNKTAKTVKGSGKGEPAVTTCSHCLYAIVEYIKVHVSISGASTIVGSRTQNICIIDDARTGLLTIAAGWRSRHVTYRVLH